MDSESSDGDGFGIEVILQDAKDEKSPCCAHGKLMRVLVLHFKLPSSVGCCGIP